MTDPIFTDEFAGQGGSYVLDPKTGKRTLVERTQDQDQAPAPAPAQPVKAPKAQE